MKRITILLFAIVFALCLGSLYAQESQVYISYLAGNVDVDTTPKNEQEDYQPAELDMPLPPGSIIRTGSEGLCEITMADGSTIQISKGSVFQVEEYTYEQETGKKSGRFSLLFGKIKAKVQKLLTPDSEFEVVSGTSLAGIRGTEFGVDFDGVVADVLCFEGSVSLESTTGVFEPMILSGGKMVSIPKDQPPRPIRDIPEDVLKKWQSEAEEFAKEIEKEAAEIAEEGKPKPEEKKAPEKESFIEKFLKMNAYVGTVTIDDNVYARWVFTPELTIGKLGLGLYLPAIFSPDVGILGFQDWQNHDEWDFRNFKDGVHDFILKFYYVSWGQWGDPLYFKIGSIDDFYLGHGFIVDNYSNMVYFPEERTLGLQFNVDAGRAGFETMVADFTRFQLMGGRFYVRPLGEDIPLAFGASAVHDRPKSEPTNIDGTTSEDQLPRIFVFGSDVELPIIALDVFSMEIFGDAAKMGYMYKELPTDLQGKIDAGALEFVKGLGTSVGLMGKIARIFRYKAAYRYILNYYEPGMVDSLWENRRLAYPDELQDLILYQKSESFEDTTTAGIFISGGMVLFKEKLDFGLEFKSYTKISGAEETPVKKGSMYVNVAPGLVPKVYGSLSYNRTDKLEDIFQDPFDENTVLVANISYQLAQGIALSVDYKRTFDREDQPIDSFGISTHFSFF